MEEVTVLGTQTEDAALDDLVSSAVLDAEKLADAGIENVEDVAAYVPNLVLSETSTGTNIVIRGIGAGTNQGFDQSVGLYIDGVPLPRAQMARAPFLDLSGVQVLRGPQYVRDGNYSIAGSVHMLTAEADDEFKLSLDLTSIPSQDDRKALVTLGTPLGDFGAMRLAIQRQRSDGYVKNVTLEQDGPQRDNLLMRGVFSFQPTDDLSIKLKVEKGSFDSRGRQIEIIESQATPDFRQFPEVLASSLTRNPSPSTVVKNGQNLTVIPELRNEFDYYLDTIRSNYDVAYTNTKVAAFAGLSYVQALHNLYTDAQDLKAIEGVPTSTGFYEPPAGLLDSSVNFRRAANEPEFSENDTTNYTLNLQYYLGEHSFKLVASDIEYDFNELIDSDFTPVPILRTVQTENYQQKFYRFEYNSPKDEFLEFTFGASYQDYDLQFDENIRAQFGGPTDQASTEAYLQDLYDVLPSGQAILNFDPADFITFDPNLPFNSYFGRISPLNIISLQVFSPSRQFRQEADTTAAFFETTVHFTDSFRTTLGARYTKADKAAVRDYLFAMKNGQPFAFPGATEFQVASIQLIQTLASVFNFAEHSDREVVSPGRSLFPTSLCPNIVSRALGGPCDPDPDNAPFTEESFLPSLTLSWDVSNDLQLLLSARMANKLGGFDARSVSVPKVTRGVGLQPGTFRFQDEDATTFEFGSKWYLPGGFGELYATLFHTTFKNLQVSTADRSVGFNVRNAGKATAKGIEVEGLLQPTEKFSMNYSLAWIDFEFQDFPFGSCSLFERPDTLLISAENNQINAVFPLGSLVPIVYEAALPDPARPPSPDFLGFAQAPINPVGLDPNGGNFRNIQRFDYRRESSATFCDFKGKTNQYVAEYQGTFSFNYENEIRGLGVFRPTVDVLYNSGYPTTVTQDKDVAQDEYFQFNGRLGLASFDETWEVALIGENLTNEKIVGYASEVPVGSRIQGSKTHLGFVRPPRSIGVNFRYNFY